MKLKAFSIFDSKAEAYIQPFFHRATGEAIRAFETACSKPDHAFHIHAADYTLFEIGTFDESNACLTKKVPLNLGNALQFQPSEVSSSE